MINLVEIKPDLGDKNIKDYRKFNSKIYREILALTKKAKQKTIIHINSTPLGGGVAEILKSQVPLEKSLGLDSHWLVIEAEQKFFVITKKIHDLLQGKDGFLSEQEKEFYFSTNRQLEKKLVSFLKKFKGGVVVIHDPQPLPLINAIPENFFSLLRLHIDLSLPNPSILEFLRSFIVKYDLVVISNKDYIPALPWVKKTKLKIIYPTIDPLSIKNKTMNLKTAKEILVGHGINPKKPFIVQISRFDLWKGQIDVIKAYHLAKNKIPDLQLVLVGFFEAKDDPEAILFFKQLKEQVKGDNDIHLFYNPKQLIKIPNSVFVNALCAVSPVIIQGSIREGFGLTITEAMWKGKPLIARVTSGSKIQVKNKKNGILVNSPEEMAEWISRLFKDKKTREKLGKSAKESVKRNFLIPKYILDNLKLYTL